MLVQYTLNKTYRLDVGLCVAGHSNQTASDWQWLHNYGTLLRATDAFAKRSCLPTSVFHIRDKERGLKHLARHPLVGTLFFFFC